MESQTICSSIVPKKPVAWTFPNGTDSITEKHRCFKCKAFYDAAAWKTQEWRMHLFKLFCKILAKSVTVKCFCRHKRTKAKVKGSFFLTLNGKSSISCCFSGQKLCIIAFPISIVYDDIAAAGCLIIYLNGYRQMQCLFWFCKQIEIICLSFFLINAIISDVIDFAIFLKINLKRNAPIIIECIIFIKLHVCIFGIPGRNCGWCNFLWCDPVIHSLAIVELINPSCWRSKCFAIIVCDTAIGKQRTLKETITKHLWIQAAVTSMADIFKK